MWSRSTWTQAAALTGALAAAGCYTSSPQQQYSPPPPPPPDPGSAHQQQPPPPPDETPEVRTAEIHGVVTADTGGPAINVEVRASRQGDASVISTRTDATGRYAFTNLPAGQYNIFAPAGAVVQLTVTDGLRAQIDLTIQRPKAPPPPKPYGAPPARKRVV
jgi:hypothetical protein